MSPEQALGQRQLIDHRSDIYSLGVTLYEILALERPFAAESRERLIREISESEPRPLRSANPAIPHDLETVILKAIAKSSDDRYATAQEMAEDLHRFLEDRPVLARRPTGMQKTRKWARRHRRVLSVAGTMLVLGIIGGLAASTGLIWSIQRKTQTAYQAELEQRRRAEKNELLARRAVDDMYTDVANAGLPASRTCPRCASFWEKAQLLSEPIGREGAEPLARYCTAQAYYPPVRFRASWDSTLGDGSLPPGNWFARAASIRNSQETDYSFDLFRTHMTLAFAWAVRRLTRLKPHTKAYAILERLVASHPDNASFRDALAHQATNLAIVALV